MNESTNRTLKSLKPNDEVFIATFCIDDITKILGSEFVVLEISNGYIKLKKKNDEKQIISLTENFKTTNGSETLLDHWYVTPKPDNNKIFYTGIFTSKDKLSSELQKVIEGNKHAAEVQKKLEDSEK